jgi:thiosulfate/3-mercaptopyruvate sulfurtransferase
VMSCLGISADTLVVAYDDANGMFAARLYWSLNYYGHSQVAVLQGGWQKWIAEGRPVTAEIPLITPTPFIAKPQPHLIRTAEQVANRNGNSLLIDVRTVGEFQGKASRAARFGHIPGAINMPRTEFLNKEGLPLSDLEVRQRVHLDQTPDEMVCYCNGGVSASYGFLALRDAGYDNVAIYDGSWKEWGNDESRPIE